MIDLSNIDPEKIQAPNSTLVNDLMSKTIDPDIYVEWLLLFDAYNRVPGNLHKGMGCRPCYGVVYNWYQKELYKQKNHE